MMVLLIATLILTQATNTERRCGYKDIVMSPSEQQKIAKYILQSR
jgi:hypothetical protein